ncbi:hypothetical protein KUCAC02_004466, partial [Chaenocephalus aceratus]
GFQPVDHPKAAVPNKDSPFIHPFQLAAKWQANDESPLGMTPAKYSLCCLMGEGIMDDETQLNLPTLISLLKCKTHKEDWRTCSSCHVPCLLCAGRDATCVYV